MRKLRRRENGPGSNTGLDQKFTQKIRKVKFRGQEYPSNYKFIHRPKGKIKNGERVGIVQGQEKFTLYWENGSVVARQTKQN